MKDVKVTCNHCGWSENIWGTHPGMTLPTILKRAWSLGLDHAWENKGHVVETFVDGHLKATQQVAEMNAWKDHNAVIVEEGVDRER